MTGNSEFNLVLRFNVDPNHFYSTQICLKNFKNIVDTRPFHSGLRLPWHYLSQTLPKIPPEMSVLARGRNYSFGSSEQTGQHPNNSAVVVNATRTRILHSLYSFFNLMKKNEIGVKMDTVIQCHRKEGRLSMQFLVLAALLLPILLISGKPGPWGRKSTLSCNTGFPRLLQVQRAGAKAQKDNVSHASW